MTQSISTISPPSSRIQGLKNCSHVFHPFSSSCSNTFCAGCGVQWDPMATVCLQFEVHWTAAPAWITWQKKACWEQKASQQCLNPRCTRGVDCRGFTSFACSTTSQCSSSVRQHRFSSCTSVGQQISTQKIQGTSFGLMLWSLSQTTCAHSLEKKAHCKEKRDICPHLRSFTFPLHIYLPARVGHRQRATFPTNCVDNTYTFLLIYHF